MIVRATEEGLLKVTVLVPAEKFPGRATVKLPPIVIEEDPALNVPLFTIRWLLIVTILFDVAIVPV